MEKTTSICPNDGTKMEQRQAPQDGHFVVCYQCPKCGWVDSACMVVSEKLPGVPMLTGDVVVRSGV